MKAQALLVLVVVLLQHQLAFSQTFREAVRTGNVQQVKDFLESGTDVNAPYENRFTVIYFASDPKVVDLLLAHGAKLNTRDAASLQTPIERAAYQYAHDKKQRDNWKIIVNKLRKAGSEYTIDTAIYMNDIEFIKKLLDKDVSWINKTKARQSLPLRISARTGRVEICNLLLKHKADPNAFEQGNRSPIMADAVKHSAIVKLLIENNANLKRRITRMGGGSGVRIIGDEATVLHHAISSGNFESVKLLIDAGLDPSASDIEGQTPLHIAIRFEHWDTQWGRDTTSFQKIVDYLIENDASIQFTNKAGKTPLDLAKKLKCSKGIRKALRNKQKELDTAYNQAMFGNN